MSDNDSFDINYSVNFSFCLGMAYGNLRRPEQAIEVFQRALALQPENAKLHCNIAGYRDIWARETC